MISNGEIHKSWIRYMSLLELSIRWVGDGIYACEGWKKKHIYLGAALAGWICLCLGVDRRLSDSRLSMCFVTRRRRFMTGAGSGVYFTIFRRRECDVTVNNSPFLRRFALPPPCLPVRTKRAQFARVRTRSTLCTFRNGPFYCTGEMREIKK